MTIAAMQVNDALVHALRESGRCATIIGTRNLSGGCIHQVLALSLGDGSRLVVKVNRADRLKLFEEEAHGLVALAGTRTVLVPQPLIAHAYGDVAVLLMTEIESPARGVSPSAWRRFGEELAALHGASAGNRYGFSMDNHIGSTLQPNSWRDDWVEFNAANRLGFQLDQSEQNGLLNAGEAREVQRVIDRLDQFIPRRPRPAWLHGDLWSGNALPAANDRIAVIDPACSIGDAWADIAMMRLFGGFSEPCFDSYLGNQPDREDVESRIAVYQLYHVLNHLNIFGRGYVGQALSLANRLR